MWQATAMHTTNLYSPTENPLFRGTVIYDLQVDPGQDLSGAEGRSLLSLGCKLEMAGNQATKTTPARLQRGSMMQGHAAGRATLLAEPPTITPENQTLKSNAMTMLSGDAWRHDAGTCCRWLQAPLLSSPMAGC